MRRRDGVACRTAAARARAHAWAPARALGRARSLVLGPAVLGAVVLGAAGLGESGFGTGSLLSPAMALAAPAARAVADLVREADAAFDRGEHDRARDLYRQAVDQGAGGAHALARLGLLESWDGDLKASVEHYRKALLAAPDDVDLSLGLARVLSWKNDLGAAIGIYEDLRAKYPDDARVLLGLGQALAWQGRYASAEALYRGMEERRIEPIQAHLGLARVIAWRGRLDEAAHFYRDILRADPGNVDARLGVAEIAHWRGLDRAAQEQARNIVLDHPDNREARKLQQTIDESLAPRSALEGFRFSDNDGNRVDSGTVSWTYMAEPQTSIRVAYSAYEAEFRCKNEAFCDELSAGPAVDQVVSTRAEMLMAGVTSRLIGSLTFQARLGAARQETFGDAERTVAVGGGFIRWQVGPRLALVGTGAREALFDTAPLIDRGIKVDGADLRLEYKFRPAWILSGSANYGSYSDGNARRSAAAGIEWRLPPAHPHLSATLEARYREFNADKSDGYFDPLRYDSELATVVIWDDYRRGRITWRVEETYGRQSFDAGSGSTVEAGTNDRVQAVYASLAVGFGTRASLEAFYAQSNFALQLATGFTSSRSGFVFRLRY